MGGMSDGWIYVIPHRCDNPKIHEPDALIDMNLQRLARILEWKTSIAFVGAGASLATGKASAKSWPDLLEGLAEDHETPLLDARRLKEATQFFDTPTLLQFVIEAAEIREDKDWPRKPLVNLLKSSQDGRATSSCDPISLLFLQYQVRRYLTTNYDTKIEDSISRHRDVTGNTRVFDQRATGHAALFSIALHPFVRQSVYHCHGTIKETPVPDADRDTDPGANRFPIIFSEDSYKYWYLSEEPQCKAFRDWMEVTLQSNPVIFIGYSFGDSDLMRVLRQISISRPKAGRAWKHFVVSDEADVRAEVRKTVLDSDDAEALERYKAIADQLKYSVNVFPFDHRKESLCEVLNRLSKGASDKAEQWRAQPRGQRWRPERVRTDVPSECEVDRRLMRPDSVKRDKVVSTIRSMFERRRVVYLLGDQFCGKYLKARQVAEAMALDGYNKVVFSAQGNEDIYAYLDRIVQRLGIKQTPALAGRISGPAQRLQSLLADDSRHERTIIVINGLERFLDVDLSAETPAEITAVRNGISRNLLTCLREAGERAPSSDNGIRLLFTTRFLPSGLFQAPDEDNSTQGGISAGERRREFEENCCVRVREDGADESWFSERDLKPDLWKRGWSRAYEQLKWEFRGRHAALLTAVAYLGGLPTQSERQRELESLLGAVSNAASQKSSRTIRFIVGRCSKRARRPYDALLCVLSCFSRPVRLEVIVACIRYLRDDFGWKGADSERAVKACIKDLCRSRLLRAMEYEGEGPGSRSYAVPAVVRHYCRTFRMGRPARDSRVFGLFGYTSRGPFSDAVHNERDIADDSGLRQLPQNLQRHLGECAKEAVQQLSAASSLDDKNHARRLVRAACDVLRTNFSCNGVARWGKYDDYIAMCSAVFDLIKNYSVRTGQTWTPGAKDASGNGHLTDSGPATLEEILWVLNELGLGFYAEGSIQDALSVWGLAFRWTQKMGPGLHTDMYSASLYCHLGAAYIQIGRLSVARDFLLSASEKARRCENEDLEQRLVGFRAKINELRGSVIEAKKD